MPKVTAKSGIAERLPTRKSRAVFGDVSNDNKRSQRTCTAKSSSEATANNTNETTTTTAPVTRRRSTRLSLLGDNNNNAGETGDPQTNNQATSSKQLAVITDTRRRSTRARSNNNTNKSRGTSFDATGDASADVAVGESDKSNGATATRRTRSAKRVAAAADEIADTSDQDKKPAARPTTRAATSRNSNSRSQSSDSSSSAAIVAISTRTTRSTSAGRTSQVLPDDATERTTGTQSTRRRGRSSTRAAPVAKGTTRPTSQAVSNKASKTKDEAASRKSAKSAGKRDRQGAATTSPRKTRRASSKSRVTKAANITEEAVVELPGKDSFPDFISETDYNLVRVPFDATKFTRGVAPVDIPDRENPFMATEYVTDMFQRLFHEEVSSRPVQYMGNQPKLNASMRAILVDWLVEVHMKFRLVPETLYLCVNIIDRYLSVVEVERSRLQLVGVAALLVACKYEEIYPPEVRDCVYITDRAYTRQEVLDMESEICDKLKYKLTVPTAHPFLQRFLHILKASKIQKIAANYYMERMLQECSSLKFRPSELAAACTCLAINNPGIRNAEGITGPLPGIPQALLDFTGFETSKVLEAAAKVCVKVRAITVTVSRRELVAVKRKYDENRYVHVSSTFDEPDMQHITAAYED